MKNKKILLVITVVIAIIGLGVVIIFNKNESVEDLSSTNTTDSIDIDINTDDDDEKIDWSVYENVSYKLTKSLNITSEGVYNLTGTITNGSITINTSGNVKLVLDGVSITNKSGPAIYVKQAEDVVIELANESKNYLEDGSAYSGYDADVIGTLFSHDDLTLQGTGSLEVISNNEDAIVGKDDLKFVSGTYIINATDDAIRGKDSVYIQDGTYTITSGGDGIKSTNDTDTSKGYILIENGTFNITSTLDAMQAETKLSIKNGTYTIETGGGSGIVSTDSTWGNWEPPTTSSSTKKSDSAKGLKATKNLVIENGTFDFNTSDDAIHCNSYAGIKNANITISSGDDGIHADNELIIDSGNIDITKSYEGLEAAKMTINGGTISIVASDDGINIAGGQDSSAQSRPGANNYAQTSNNTLTINDGTIYINSTGDGIDVNGSAYINGGNIQVDGPSRGGNGALDYDSVFQVNGGTLLAAGESGMLQGCSSSSKIYNVTIIFKNNYGSDDKITITDSNNNEVISYSSKNGYNSLVIASPKFESGQTYTIKVNNSTYDTFKISNITTTVGTSNNYGGGGPGQRR